MIWEILKSTILTENLQKAFSAFCTVMLARDLGGCMGGDTTGKGDSNRSKEVPNHHAQHIKWEEEGGSV